MKHNNANSEIRIAKYYLYIIAYFNVYLKSNTVIFMNKYELEKFIKEQGWSMFGVVEFEKVRKKSGKT